MTRDGPCPAPAAQGRWVRPSSGHRSDFVAGRTLALWTGADADRTLRAPFASALSVSARLRLLCLLLTLASTACVGPPTRLDQSLAATAKADRVFVLLPQSEIDVDDPFVGDSQTGVIGMVVEGVIATTMARNRQKAIAPLRVMLQDLQFEARVVDSLGARLPTQLVRPGAPVVIVRSEAELREQLRSVLPANVLLMSMRYAFEQNFEIAYVHAHASLSRMNALPMNARERMQLGASERKRRTPVVLHEGAYASQHVTRSPFEDLDTLPDEAGYQRAARTWIESDREFLGRVCSDGIDEVVGLIARDAESSLRSLAGDKVRAHLAHPELRPFTFTVSRVESARGRSLLHHSQVIAWVDDRQVRPVRTR